MKKLFFIPLLVLVSSWSFSQTIQLKKLKVGEAFKFQNSTTVNIVRSVHKNAIYYIDTRTGWLNSTRPYYKLSKKVTPVR